MVLGLKLSYAASDFEMILFSVYLPPESSNWGRDAQAAFNHLLCTIYSNAHIDNIVICGDLNSRIGDKEDSVLGIDDIPERMAIDDVSNQHGNSLKIMSYTHGNEQQIDS